MDFGVITIHEPVAFAELGRIVEDLGFESLFVPEHTHLPVERSAPWPYQDLPPNAATVFDPLVALAVVAGATTKLKLGTGVCLVTQRDPIILAKEVASLDVLSGGRLLFGVGPGWIQEELANHGTPPEYRWRVMHDRITAMKAIWTQHPAEYRGEYVTFAPMWSLPKPQQQPHPPILVAGRGPHVLQRVVEYGDGWIPIAGQVDIGARMAELQRLAEARGRPPLPVTMVCRNLDPEELKQFAHAGVARVLVDLPSVDLVEIRPFLQTYASTVRSLTAST